MPTYQYACTSCGERLEVVQKFSDDPLTVCPACSGALRKVFSPVGVVFKGSGFYKTDSRPAKKSASSSGTTETKSGAQSGAQSGDGAGTKSETKSGPTKSDTPKSDGGRGDSSSKGTPSATSGQVA